MTNATQQSWSKYTIVEFTSDFLFRHSQSSPVWASTIVRCTSMHVSWWRSSLWHWKFCHITLQLVKRRPTSSLWVIINVFISLLVLNMLSNQSYFNAVMNMLGPSLMIDWKKNSWNPERVSTVVTQSVCVCVYVCFISILIFTLFYGHFFLFLSLYKTSTFLFSSYRSQFYT